MDKSMFGFWYMCEQGSQASVASQVLKQASNSVRFLGLFGYFLVRVVRASLAPKVASEAKSLLFGFAQLVRVVRVFLWKICAKGCGKVCGEKVEKIVGKSIALKV